MASSHSSKDPQSPSMMDSMMGLLRVRVKRGINLVVRDVRSSDPYVVLKLGKQKVKTGVKKKDINPEWNEDLTLSIANPNQPIMLTVYDHDTFSKDDKMGDAEFSIKPFLEAVRMELRGVEEGSVVTRQYPSQYNCLADGSCIKWTGGSVVQDLCLRLRNVERGEVEIQLHWIHLPASKGI